MMSVMDTRMLSWMSAMTIEESIRNKFMKNLTE